MRLLSRQDQPFALVFERRKTRLPSAPPIAFTAEFSEDESKQRQWTSFNSKNRLYIESVPLKTFVSDIEQFIMPLVRGVTTEGHWSQPWKQAGLGKKAEAGVLRRSITQTSSAPGLTRS